MMVSDSDSEEYVPGTPPPTSVYHDNTIQSYAAPIASFDVRSQVDDPLSSLNLPIIPNTYSAPALLPGVDRISQAVPAYDTRNVLEQIPAPSTPTQLLTPHISNTSNINHSALTLPASGDVRKLYGKRVPQGTLNKNYYSMKLFAQFIQKSVRERPHLYGRFVSIVNSHDTKIVPGSNEHERLIVRLLTHTSPHRSFDEDSKRILKHFLAEFVVHHRKKDGTECEPATMNAYANGIRRALSNLGLPVDLRSDEVMNEGSGGITTVMNNHFANQQARGMGTKPHNTLAHADIRHLCIRVLQP